MKTIVHIVGARPNFVKAAAVYDALKDSEQIIIHTGQHYDTNMSDDICAELGIIPTYNLHEQNTAEIQRALMPLLQKLEPDWVLVYGDVNSSLAGALAATETYRHLAHIEAGLRCGDSSMPEEINRYVIDHLADKLFAPSQDAVDNLAKEAVQGEIHLVGNVMIDTLTTREFAHPPDNSKQYGLLTLHRPENVDCPSKLDDILNKIDALETKIIFPVHPRVKLQQIYRNIATINPLSYSEFIYKLEFAKFVITDSGGVQEESSYLNIPCLTLRKNTERPITVKLGTNTLVTPENLAFEVAKINNGKGKSGECILWRDQAAKRIADILYA